MGHFAGYFKNKGKKPIFTFLSLSRVLCLLVPKYTKPTEDIQTTYIVPKKKKKKKKPSNQAEI